ncbi:MAG: hypothetical protein NBV67_12205 [Tagaea sp.]|nr:hypothetical protein [Tagaea sp.]
MPISAKDIDTLSSYADGVIGRADHHAQQVNEIALAILGGVAWRADKDTILIRGKGGDMKNVLWFSVGSQKYALSYNNTSSKIELRSDNLRGPTIKDFDNTTPASDVRATFGLL